MVLNRLRDVAVLDRGGDIGAVAGDFAGRCQHLVVGVAYHHRVANHLRGAPGELPEVVGVQVAAEERLPPHGKLAALEHQTHEGLLEIARRGLASDKHHVARGLVVLLVQLALNVDEHDPVARLGNVVALEVCHGAQAHDTL